MQTIAAAANRRYFALVETRNPGAIGVFGEVLVVLPWPEDRTEPSMLSEAAECCRLHGYETAGVRRERARMDLQAVRARRAAEGV